MDLEVDKMSEVVEKVYNSYIANEVLKSGTKYERLAAVVYKILEEDSTVIQDLRLRGDGKTAQHQIDVTIEKSGTKKRVLVECKDYDCLVGIGIVRDFFGAVSQIKPDEAIVVTTEGFTKGAVKFAQDESIKLAILREFNEEDWDGRIKKIITTMRMIFMDTPQITNWIVADPSQIEKVKQVANTSWGQVQKSDATITYFYDENGNKVSTFQQILSPIFNSFSRTAEQKTQGKYEFDSVRYIKLFGILISVRGFEYEFTSHESITKTVIDEGKKVATLLYKMLDGTIDTIIFDQDLNKWSFDGNNEVIQKIK